MGYNKSPMIESLDEETIQQIIVEYQTEPISKNVLAKRYNVDWYTIDAILKKYNIPDNGYGRFSQPYEIVDDYATIRIRKGKGFVYAKIDIEDIERCKEIGIWSLTKAGYVANCNNGIYLHRFIMNCPNNFEVDHIFHDPLDNRKSQLRIATSSQQKMNVGLRSDNSSGHRGVFYDNSRGTWNVNINLKDNRLHKRFKTYEEACKVADEFYDTHFGEYKYKVV